ncbi:glycosyltransferase family 4 protein [Catenulispora sp. NF23]|uniref:glycosyltransferase family 4 protein n=1 Tax=Catenulispora pinistramenti TaxID=2705254 RepID=UPI001BAB8E12|nr:glycosyltransferase family 4 protein [Catenulispora pinistramenti]MBS2532089.1 glycosyltransferase family 4 protein [Catenulispora pinistramenti]
MTNDRRLSARRPRVAMLVANDVRLDSRVQKAAYSAAEAGYDVLLLGYEPNRKGRPSDPAYIGAAQVVRTGLHNKWQIAQWPLKDGGAPGLRLMPFRALSFASSLDYKARRRIVQRIKEPGTGDGSVKHRAKEALWKVYFRDGDWRRTARHLLWLESSWSALIEEFEPDLIHAHDMHTPGIAVRVADRLAHKGKRPKVLYDAHEFVAGVSMPEQRRLAYVGLEGEYVRKADAVITVSPLLAQWLQERYHLTETPGVVANAPMLHLPGEEREPGGPDAGTDSEADAERGARADQAEAPSLRKACGLASDVPLLVYSGAVSPMRGIATMVAGLPELPDVHMAVVRGADTEFTRALEKQAEELGVADRLHMVGYVAPHLVPQYLASADIGVIPILHTPNHEVALITKYYEYMHAKLPIVVSDVQAMADFTRELGNGEVFTAEDAHEYAQAVAKVLADRAAYASRYTDDLLAANSWEGQAEVLGGVYARLLGQEPEPRTGVRAFGETSEPTA